jgi:hypothetical protein
MGNTSLCKRKFDRTRDETRHNKQKKEHYWRKKRERPNIEERNDDNVNRDFQQEEAQSIFFRILLDDPHSTK